MRGGALPPALICAALGFALSFAPRRMLVACVMLLAVTAIATSRIKLGAAWDDAIFFGCWVGVIVTAAAVHLPGGPGPAMALALTLNAGVWTGETIAAAGAPIDLGKALPLVLLCFPGRWLIATNKAIAIKVVASWLVAVSILAATLSLVPVTPGYKPDHLE